MYRFLIYISYSYALPIGQPLENEIKNRNHKIKWFADEEDGKKAIADKRNILKSVTDLIEYAPHIVLTITDNVPDFIPGLKVQIFHGFFAQKRPVKKNKFAHFRLRGFFDLYCTQGPSSTIPFQELAKDHGYFEVIETGWSKVDPLFPLKEKSIPEKPIIFIASTFTENLSLAFKKPVFNEIKRLSKTGDFKFLMTLHPKIKNEVRVKWKSLENENFRFFETTDLIPLFQQSDIMFSDNSSAIQEYLLQEKPVVAYNHNFAHNYIVHAHEAGEIEEAFQKALIYPQELIENIKAFIKLLHPYNDGQSSKRVIDTCIAQLHRDKSHLNRKPLNLIRKYKIRKQLGYFTLKSLNKPFTIPKDEFIKN